MGEHGGGGRSFPRAFERREIFLLIRGNFIEEFEGHVKESFGNGQLSIGAPDGKPGGDSFNGPFERQMKEGSGNGTSLFKFIWIPFLDQNYVRRRIWGQSETSVKDRAPMTWHQSMGHKGPVLSLRCIGTERAQSQLLSL